MCGFDDLNLSYLIIIIVLLTFLTTIFLYLANCYQKL